MLRYHNNIHVRYFIILFYLLKFNQNVFTTNTKYIGVRSRYRAVTGLFLYPPYLYTRGAGNNNNNNFITVYI